MEFGANEQDARESGRYPGEDGTRSGELPGWLAALRGRTRTATGAAQRRLSETRQHAAAGIRDHPYAAITVALAAGLVIGILIARR